MRWMLTCGGSWCRLSLSELELLVLLLTEKVVHWEGWLCWPVVLFLSLSYHSLFSLFSYLFLLCFFPSSFFLYLCSHIFLLFLFCFFPSLLFFLFFFSFLWFSCSHPFTFWWGDIYKGWWKRWLPYPCPVIMKGSGGWSGLCAVARMACLLCPFHHGGRPWEDVGCVGVFGQVGGREREKQALQMRGETFFPRLCVSRGRRWQTVP